MSIELNQNVIETVQVAASEQMSVQVSASGDRVFEVCAAYQQHHWDVRMVIRVGDDLRIEPMRTKDWILIRYFETREDARQHRDRVLLALADGETVFALGAKGTPPMEISPADFDFKWRMPRKFIVHERRKP